MTRISLAERVGHDLRAACRTLRAAPGFSSVVLTVLALAMGATTAVFSVVDAVVLRGLPFDHADRIVAVDRTINGRVVISSFSAPEFLTLRAQQDMFEGLAAVASGSLMLRRDGAREPDILRMQRVSAEFFPVLRVTPAIGRPFTIGNEVAGRDLVAVISFGLWQRRFGGAVDVLGKRLPSARGDLEIIGVMPAEFAYPVGAVQATDLWVPYVVPENERSARVGVYLRLIARLKDGMTLERAQARIDGIAAANIAAGTGDGFEQRPTLRDLRGSLAGYARPWMLMLLSAVACVLLIACANIANLLLVRATVRAHELSVRTALGATRWDLARMLLAESLLLATTGTALGIGIAWWGIDSLRSLLPPDLPRLSNIAIDVRVLAAAGATALVTGLAFGLAPVYFGARTVSRVLMESGRGSTTSVRRQWLRTTLLVVEVALAVVLLVGTALFLTSFARLIQIDVGVEYRNVLMVDVRPRPTPTSASGAGLENLLKRMSEIPGVETAALATSNLPFSLSFSSRPIDVPGGDRPSGAAMQPVGVSNVSQQYFHVLRVPLRHGRFFTSADSDASAAAVILNETAAKTLFPGQDPIGQLVGIEKRRTVVGVVGDVRASGPEGNVQPQAFLPIVRGEAVAGTLLLKITGNSAAILPRVRAAIWSEVPDLAVPAPRTLEQSFGALIAQRRFSMFLLSLFGFLGVTMAGVGIYGVMAYVVAQRTREIGIRMALGALPSTVLRSVLQRASSQVGLGLLAGLGVAWLTATSVEKFLFRVEPHDLRLYAAVGGVLIAAAFAAALVPAHRAARVDPVVALRSE
jgi:putative ABC transport system permease protein